MVNYFNEEFAFDIPVDEMYYEFYGINQQIYAITQGLTY